MSAHNEWITERAALEISRLDERLKIKEAHRVALKEYDTESRKLIAANKAKYAVMMAEAAKAGE